jgi:hypothetical protein
VRVRAVADRLRAVPGVVAVAALFFGFRAEFEPMGRNIPRGSFGTDLFAASNLPSGLAAMAVTHRFAPELWFEPSSAPVRIASFAVLLVWCGAQSLNVSRHAGLGAAFVRMAERDKLVLALGSAVIVGCFFAGQSVGYCGIFLIFVVAGLVALRRGAQDGDRPKLMALILSVLFSMCYGAFRQALGTVGLPLHAGLWLVNELLWWWLAAALIGMLVIFARGSDAVVETRRWVDGRAQWLATSGRRHAP